MAARKDQSQAIVLDALVILLVDIECGGGFRLLCYLRH